MGTTHLSGLEVAGVPTMGIAGAPMFSGTWYFVDAVNGSDGNVGSADQPLQTLYCAHSRMTAGSNDVAVLVGNGSTTATQRLSLAGAQVFDSTATAGTLVWSKNACHLIGMTAPTGISNRARIAPVTTDTMAAFGSGNFVTVTAQGCYFSNFSVFNGFATGGAAQICWTDSGGRNYYNSVDFAGAGDTASAQSTTSRSLLVTGTVGENVFGNCTIGTDTVTKTVANASLEFAAGSPRNTFNACNFPIQTSSATTLVIKTAAAASMDRWQKFDRCTFINGIKSTSTTLSAMATLAASSGGLILMKDCTLVGITEFGSDATSLALIYVDGGTVTAATSGIAVNPS